MTTLVKIAIAAVLALGAFGGVALAQASNGADDPGVELRGPCDEAEHATDARCVGARNQAAARQREDRAGVDDRQRRHRHRGTARGRDDNSSSHRGRSGRSHAEDR